MALEFFLAAAQRCLIGLDLAATATDFRRFLCGHAAMLVELDWVVRHNRLPFPACAVPIFAIRRTRASVRKDVTRSRRGTLQVGCWAKNYPRIPPFQPQNAAKRKAFRPFRAINNYIALTNIRFNSKLGDYSRLFPILLLAAERSAAAAQFNLGVSATGQANGTQNVDQWVMTPDETPHRPWLVLGAAKL
jgi:hypothetical protein